MRRLALSRVSRHSCGRGAGTPFANVTEWDSECRCRFLLPQETLAAPAGPELVRHTDDRHLLSTRPLAVLQPLRSPPPADRGNDARGNVATHSIWRGDAALRRANLPGSNPDGHCSLPYRGNIFWLGRGHESSSSAAPWQRRSW